VTYGKFTANSCSETRSHGYLQNHLQNKPFTKPYFSTEVTNMLLLFTV